MEKLFMIMAEICAILLSILCVYHHFNSGYDSDIAILFSIVFAIMAIWCHSIQRTLRFDFRLW